MVSVVIPCYNQGQYLAEALDSVLAQTFQSWECIIVNNSSPDETALIAQQFIKQDSRFKYLSIENKGVSVARNEGIRLASGEFILPLDADDKIAPFYLEKAVNAFSDDSSLCMVYGEAEFFGDMHGRWELPNYSYYQLLLMNMIYCSAIFRKSDFENVGGYSAEMVHGHEDWDLWIRLLNSSSKVHKLHDVVFYYRVKPKSRTTELHKNKLEQTQRLLLQRNRKVYFNYLSTILKDLEQCKSENRAISKKLNLIKKSRLFKILGKMNFKLPNI